MTTAMTRTFSLPDQPFRLISYIRRYRAKFWIQAAGGILYNTVIVAGPIFLGMMIDAATALEQQGYSPEQMRRLTWYAVLFVLATLFFQFARYIKRWWLRDMFNRVANDLRAGLLSAVLDRPMARVERESVGDLMARTVGDVNQVVDTVQYTINETWDTWLLMVAYFVVLLIYNPWITLLCSLPIPLALYVAETLRHPMYRFSLNARKAASQVSSHLQRTLNGIGILRLFGRERAENERLEAFSVSETRWNIKTSLLQTGIMPVYASLASLGLVGVIVLGGQQVVAGQWTLGRFTAYLAMFMAMATRTRVAANVINRFHAAQAAWDRLKEKMSQDVPEAAARPTSPAQSRETAPLGDRVQIEARDLSFRFPGSAHDVLHGVTFTAPPGALVAVTGPVGSGKSALATVLTGLYEYGGSILANARELRDLSAAERVRAVAYSGQDSFIFSASIAQNITLQPAGTVPDDDPRLQQALHIAALTEDLALFPDGLATVVGERGARVSGGQRQRIALARAIYASSPLLVLDDPFSAVDIGTERRMVERLHRELTGNAASPRTLFLFSHRLAAFTQADLILVLNSGRVVEQGTHDALLAAGGIYARIFSAQDWLEHEAHG
ncbi:MAG: ABC transporter ATP-binding protein [Anaerolineae bacterium]|nr:ABC transporter ATP-binding protein [Anaerolineae bacterium]